MIRAARALLNMSQTELADITGVTKRTIIRHEVEERSEARRGELQQKIRDEFEKRDIEFLFPNDTKGEGVRFARRR